jgi:hypothetical protein
LSRPAFPSQVTGGIFLPAQPVFCHETVNFEHLGGFFCLAEKNGPPYIPRIGLNRMTFRHLE